MSDKRTCESCRFWAQWGDRERDGTCRRRPPRETAGWPVVGRGDWCGEHDEEPPQRLQEICETAQATWRRDQEGGESIARDVQEALQNCRGSIPDVQWRALKRDAESTQGAVAADLAEALGLPQAVGPEECPVCDSPHCSCGYGATADLEGGDK